MPDTFPPSSEVSVTHFRCPPRIRQTGRCVSSGQVTTAVTAHGSGARSRAVCRARPSGAPWRRLISSRAGGPTSPPSAQCVVHPRTLAAGLGLNLLHSDLILVVTWQRGHMHRSQVSTRASLAGRTANPARAAARACWAGTMVSGWLGRAQSGHATCQDHRASYAMKLRLSPLALPLRASFLSTKQSRDPPARPGSHRTPEPGTPRTAQSHHFSHSQHPRSCVGTPPWTPGPQPGEQQAPLKGPSRSGHSVSLEPHVPSRT